MSQICFKRRSRCLSKALTKALLRSGFADLIYYETRDPEGRALPSPFLPQVDLAVIVLSEKNKILSASNILYDRDHPEGYDVCLDRQNLTANDTVRFSVWRQDRWVDPTIWNEPVPDKDLLTNPPKPKTSFMQSYPASCFKTQLTFYMLKLVDQGILSLDTVLTYDKKDCFPPIPPGTSETETLAYWMTTNMTISYNFASTVLLQWLYKNNMLQAANDYFQSIGLQTLNLQPLNVNCGLDWYNGKMGTGALDICKLLLIIYGVPGTLWEHEGKMIVADDQLSTTSRQFMQDLLKNQAFAEVLNPVGVCGSPYHKQGFHTIVPPEWIDPDTGSLTVPIPDDGFVLNFGYDMRPCLANATLVFSHKTGLTDYAGCDHGYVNTLQGTGKKIIVALHTSAGSLFQDPDLADQTPNACLNLNLCYSNAFPNIAKAVQKFL